MRSFMILLLGIICLSSGCQMLEWVRPHQLYKLNRQPSMARDDAYFSVPAQPVPDQKSSQNPYPSIQPF